MESPPEPPSRDELIARYGLLRPTRRAPILKSTPRVGQYYWIDFPADAFPPEFVEPHPGIVIRSARALHGTCIVVPVTTKTQTDLKHSHPLSKNPHPDYPNVQAWAVCDHLYTVNVARLRPVWDRVARRNLFLRVGKEDMDAIYACIRGALPNVFPVTTTVITEVVTETKVAVVEAGN